MEAKHLNTEGLLCTICQKYCPTRNIGTIGARKHKINDDQYLNQKNSVKLDSATKLKMIRRLDACHSCTSCDYFIKYDITCKNHIESKHPSTSGFTCQFCGKPRSTRNAPKLHTTKIIKKQLDRPYFSDSEPSLNPRWRSDLMVCGTAHFVENPLN